MRFRTFITVVLGLSAIGGQAAAQSYGVNLVKNPGAEEDTAVTKASDPNLATISQWKKTGTFNAARHGGNFFSPVSADVKEQGNNYFIGGSGGGPSTATQTVDLSSYAVDIDAGRVKFVFSSLIGVMGAADAKPLVKASFKDAKGAAVTYADRGGQTTHEVTLLPGDFKDDQFNAVYLLQRTASGFLLPGTRSVDLLIDLTRTATGAYNYSGSDEISLVLSTSAVYGIELLINGNAELGRPNYYGAMPGWNVPKEIGAQLYKSNARCATADSPCLNLQDPGPATSERGNNFFYGAFDYRRENTQADQLFDIALIRDAVDGGSVSFNLSGWLGGSEAFKDDVGLQVVFLDGAGKPLATESIPPLTPADRGNVTGLFLRTLKAPVPKGTRRIQTRLAFRQYNEKGAGGWGRGVADNISLTISLPQQNIDIQPDRIFNSASQTAGAIAPGEMLDIVANGISLTGLKRMQLADDGRISTELAGVRVFFGGTAAPLLYVDKSRIGAIVPFDVQDGVPVRLEYLGSKSNTLNLPVVAAAPGVFTQEGSGQGRGLIYSEDWLLNSLDNASSAGSIVEIIWTGGGALAPGGVDGRMENQSVPKLAQPVTVTIGGVEAEVLYAGGVPFGWAGLLQVRVRVPSVEPGDAVPVVVSTAGFSSQNGATMVIR